MKYRYFFLLAVALPPLSAAPAMAQEGGSQPMSYTDGTIHNRAGMNHDTGAKGQARAEHAIPEPSELEMSRREHLEVAAGAVAAPDPTMSEADHADHMGHMSPGSGAMYLSAPAMHQGTEMQGMEPGMNHGSPGMTSVGHATEPGDSVAGYTPASGVVHEMTAMQSGSAPPDARDPHAYSGGYDFGPIPRPRLADEQNFGSLLVDRLEYVESSDESFAAYDLQGWLGRDYDRLVIKAEGEVDESKLQEARTELLWGHAVAAYWDMQLGLRHDSGVDPSRNWLALGVQGLAPYWFEVGATAYAGEEGRSALRLDAEYELLFTQKLILQPRVEANFYGKKDEARGLGSGLSDVAAGLRLRYEVRRQIGPYIGVEWHGLYGETADFAEDADAPTDETRWVAGLRWWF